MGTSSAGGMAAGSEHCHGLFCPRLEHLVSDPNPGQARNVSLGIWGQDWPSQGSRQAAGGDGALPAAFRAGGVQGCPQPPMGTAGRGVPSHPAMTHALPSAKPTVPLCPLHLRPSPRSPPPGSPQRVPVLPGDARGGGPYCRRGVHRRCRCATGRACVCVCVPPGTARCVCVRVYVCVQRLCAPAGPAARGTHRPPRQPHRHRPRPGEPGTRRG